ncbi:MAG: SPOR domain-containing protein [Bacteroidales bacterium]|nr:SPOR domain-containing protein [Bacteroidales bacterium]
MNESSAGRIILALSCIAATAALLCGCDSFRRLAGRPTSEDIAAKKVMIEQERAAHQARLDSLRRVEKALADSLALLDEIKASKTMILTTADIKGAAAAGLQYRYYVVVGTFGDRQNAQGLAAKAEAAGYSSQLIPYRNAFTSVGVGGTNSLAEAWATLGKVKGEKFCPVDVWVLVNE